MLSFPKSLELIFKKLKFLFFAQLSSNFFFLSNLDLKQVVARALSLGN